MIALKKIVIPAIKAEVEIETNMTILALFISFVKATTIQAPPAPHNVLQISPTTSAQNEQTFSEFSHNFIPISAPIFFSFAQDLNVSISALATAMPIISKNKIISEHKIEGIGDDFVPDLLDKTILDEVILVNDEDAINMSRRLTKELGIGVGISSGANFIAGIMYQEKVNEPVVTVFADDNKKYLSTDLSKEIDNNINFKSNQITLLDYEVV